MTKRGPSLTSQLRARGFDLSHAVPFESGCVVRCSQCAAVAINGVPCHERGCPNERRECKGCNESMPANGPDYCRHCNGACDGCEDCALPDDVSADEDADADTD